MIITVDFRLCETLTRSSCPNAISSKCTIYSFVIFVWSLVFPSPAYTCGTTPKTEHAVAVSAPSSILPFQTLNCLSIVLGWCPFVECKYANQSHCHCRLLERDYKTFIWRVHSSFDQVEYIVTQGQSIIINRIVDCLLAANMLIRMTVWCRYVNVYIVQCSCIYTEYDVHFAHYALRESFECGQIATTHNHETAICINENNSSIIAIRRERERWIYVRFVWLAVDDRISILLLRQLYLRHNSLSFLHFVESSICSSITFRTVAQQKFPLFFIALSIRISDEEVIRLTFASKVRLMRGWVEWHKFNRTK